MEKIFAKIAAEHDTTPEEVREEIKAALQLAGIDEEPEAVILQIASSLQQSFN